MRKRRPNGNGSIAGGPKTRHAYPCSASCKPVAIRTAHARYETLCPCAFACPASTLWPRLLACALKSAVHAPCARPPSVPHTHRLSSLGLCPHRRDTRKTKVAGKNNIPAPVLSPNCACSRRLVFPIWSVLTCTSPGGWMEERPSARSVVHVSHSPGGLLQRGYSLVKARNCCLSVYNVDN